VARTACQSRPYGASQSIGGGTAGIYFRNSVSTHLTASTSSSTGTCP
jgi:hypothetical protein